jgi:hypothetical protein
MELTNEQAQAITGMGRATSDYNRGVLAMLGKVDLAIAHETLMTSCEIQRAERDALIPADHGMFEALPADAEAVQVKLDETCRLEAAAWAPIQALIDEAQAKLEAADPFGLDQRV